MYELSPVELQELFSALEDDAASVRLAALRAIVRLPLNREAWFQVGRYVGGLFNAPSADRPFPDQTRKGIPFSEVIAAAIFVPTSGMRGRLYDLIASSDRDVGIAAAHALASAGDAAGGWNLLDQLTNGTEFERLEAAKSLSLIKQPIDLSAVRHRFSKDQVDDVRFWLAVTLAVQGQTPEVTEVLRELRAGALDIKELLGDPSRFIDQLKRRGPFPEDVRRVFQQLADEKSGEDEDFTSQAAMALYRAGQEQPQPAGPGPVTERSANAELESLASSIEQRLDDLQVLSADLFRPDVVAYLSSSTAGRFVTLLFKYAAHEFGFAGNDIVMAVHQLGSGFTPDITGLGSAYCTIEERSSLNWQIAWTVSRAEARTVLAGLKEGLSASAERDRMLTARLVEEVAVYMRQDYPPIFGGGSGPGDLVPQALLPDAPLERFLFAPPLYRKVGEGDFEDTESAPEPARAGEAAAPDSFDAEPPAEGPDYDSLIEEKMAEEPSSDLLPTMDVPGEDEHAAPRASVIRVPSPRRPAARKAARRSARVKPTGSPGPEPGGGSGAGRAARRKPARSPGPKRGGRKAARRAARMKPVKGPARKAGKKRNGGGGGAEYSRVNSPTDKPLPRSTKKATVKRRSSPASKPRGRVINTGFALRTAPDNKLKNTMPLKAGEEYYFWVDRGWWEKATSGEVTPTDISEVPEGARLTVAVFGFRDGLEIIPGADVAEVEVWGNSPFTVRSQPEKKSPPRSEFLDQRLFFPVRTPKAAGTYRMRCNIYWGQILLQSRLIKARVMARPKTLAGAKKAWPSVLDYSISRQLDPNHLNQLSEHRLSVMLNKNGDGTHSFHLYGVNNQQELFKQDDVRFDETELQGMIEQARGTLRIASWGNQDEWKEGLAYKYKDGEKKLDRLKVDLGNLAKWGYEFYFAFRSRFAGGEEKVDELEQLMLKPGVIQIAMKESPSHILPAAMIYDYPLDTGAESFSICKAFESALAQGVSLDKLECFNGNCSSRENDTTVCPSGFWGFRHYVGMPLSLEDKGDACPAINVEKDLSMAVGVATNLQLVVKHTEAIHGLRPGVVWNYADTRERVFDVLKQSPHIVYFYCHGGLARNMPYLQVGPTDGKGLILPSNLGSKGIRWERPQPLVFINGCHTTAVSPLQALQFISPLVTYSRGAGVIGTEITIFEELATAFAEECLRRFLANESIGQAIRNARLRLLADGNPLGLVYIPFVMSGLKLQYN